MRTRIAVLLGLVVVTVMWLAPAGVADPDKATQFTVPMSGQQVVPGPADPDGSGSIFVTLQRHSGRLCFILDTENISPQLTSVDLHRAARGAAGEFLVQLHGSVNDPGFGDCVIIDRTLLRDIEKHRADYYVDVHNDEFPDGALRAQLG